MKKRENFFPIFLIFLFLSIVVLGLSKTQASANLRSFLETVSSPLQKITYGVFNGFPRIFSNSKTQDLENKNRACQALLVDQQNLIRENAALRDQFQTALPKSPNLLPAKILGQQAFIPGISLPETFTLDRGAKDGVLKGAAVVFKNNLVGKIERVSSNLSTVALLTNKNSSFTVRTLPAPLPYGTGPSKNFQALGILRGQGNGEMILENVELSENLKVSDLVLTYGDLDIKGLGYPPDLIVGRVASVDKKPSALFQKAAVLSLLDFQKLSTVFIVVGYK